MLIKLFRVGVICAFVAALLLFGHYYYNANFNVDKTIPVITVDSDSIEISLNATDEEILKGVTAYDEKDGDLTDSIMIESISKFTVKGVSTVKYVVCDKDNHVVSTTRKVTYKNYTSPKFSMKSSFCFSIRSASVIKGVICAEDCIDGDISDKVIITSSDYKSNEEGYYTCTVKVTNSKGDTSSLDLPIVVEDRSASAPVINLSDYLIYVKKGTTLHLKKYIKSITDVYDAPVSATTEINSECNTNVPGVYPVHYYATDEGGRTGHTILIVVVEE